MIKYLTLSLFLTTFSKSPYIGRIICNATGIILTKQKHNTIFKMRISLLLFLYIIIIVTIPAKNNENLGGSDFWPQILYWVEEYFEDEKVNVVCDTCAKTYSIKIGDEKVKVVCDTCADLNFISESFSGVISEA